MHLPPEGHDVSVDDPLQAEAEGTSTTQESLGTTVDANVAKRVGKITTEGQVAGSDEKHPPQDIEPDVPPMTGGAGGDGGEPPHDDPPPLTPGSPPEDGGKDMDGQASWPASDNTGEHSPGDSVGGFLGVLRKDNGVAVAQLAERVDMSSSTLYRYFNGESHPNRQGVEAIARAFGLDPAVTDQLVTAWRAEKAGNHDEAKRILSGIQLPKS
jgi:DNA-binding phage protein